MAVALNQPKVIVVMPAYNAAKTLRITYDAIPKDDVYQVILVDDGSRDETLKIAKELNLEVFVHTRNFGYGGNQKTCYTEVIVFEYPTSRHLAIRLAVLCGRFDYTDRGILDRTHLRFFTRKTCLQLLCDSGFTVDAIVPTPVPLQLVFPATGTQWFTPFHLLHYGFVRRLQGLLAFQFVVRAKPRSE